MAKPKTRDGRLALLKQGPGVFSYDGSAHDTEAVPQKLDKSGAVAQPYSLKRIPLAAYRLRGELCKKGEKFSADADLAEKCRRLGCFVEHEVDAKAKKSAEA